MLPGLDGIETLKRIKQFDENIPVIMLSAQGSIEVAVESLDMVLTITFQNQSISKS